MDRALFNQLLGGLVANLLSLELLMRFLLAHAVNEPAPAFDELKPGDDVAEGSFTNYESLGTVISRTNELLEANGFAELMDPDLVAIRDTFAHGRKVYADRDGPASLVKFGPPRRGRVKVQAAFTLSEAELRALTDRTYAEIQKVIAAGQELGLDVGLED